jgi:hypothetical protein
MDENNAFPTELLVFSRKVEEYKFTQGELNYHQKDYEYLHHAAPLTNLPGRDIEAMELLFADQNSEEIEADINKVLSWLYPEPYWGDDFDFLQDYL